MDIVKCQKHEVSSQLENLAKKTLEYESLAYSPHTIRMYKSMWNQFVIFANENSLPSLPTASETVALFLGSIAVEASLSKLNLAISAIEKFHKIADKKISGDREIYRRVRKGIRREHKEKQIQQPAKALSLVDLKVACKTLKNTPSGMRDRALLTIGFFGALRRNELVDLNIENVEINERGMIVTILQSKTSSSAVKVFYSRGKDLSVCPVMAYENWLNCFPNRTGPVFRRFYKGETIAPKALTCQSISKIMKSYFGKAYSGHSLRRGLVTEAAKTGVPIAQIQKLSRHKSLDMVMRYVEAITGFEESSVKVLSV